MKANLLKTTARLGGLLAAIALTSAAHAATIVPDTWYSSRPAVTSDENGIHFTIDSSGFQHALTYFDPVNLSNIGDSLSVSLTFSGTLGANGTNSQWPLGFGLYNSFGSQISENGLGQNGATKEPYPYRAYRGYRLRMNTAARSGNVFTFYARSTDTSSLLNGHTQIGSGQGPSGSANTVTFTDDTLYTVTYTITRTAADTMEISFLITGGDLPSTYNSSWSVSSTDGSFYTSFDTFAITLQSGNATFTDITVHNIEITAPDVIPEPAAVAALMGAAILAFAMSRRR